MPDGDRLPLGRWSCTLNDLDQFHARHDSKRRAKVWADWETLTESVREAVGRVPAVWLSGSYFTSKETPGDIDCVYVVDHDDLTQAREDPEVAEFLGVVATSQVKTYFGLEVDSFILDWWPRAGTRLGSSVRRESYLERRGYWDDLWQRDRAAGDARAQKIPSKGYLEVILDGYV